MRENEGPPFCEVRCHRFVINHISMFTFHPSVIILSNKELQQSPWEMKSADEFIWKINPHLRRGGFYNQA